MKTLKEIIMESVLDLTEAGPSPTQHLSMKAKQWGNISRGLSSNRGGLNLPLYKQASAVAAALGTAAKSRGSKRTDAIERAKKAKEKLLVDIENSKERIDSFGDEEFKKFVNRAKSAQT